jgi:cellobiose transport system substrate-binding protein
MGVTSRRGRLIVAAVATVSVLGVGACSGTNAKDNSGGTAAAGKVKLIVDTFGSFGYQDLVKEYTTKNPNIEVEIRGEGTTLDKYSPKLTQALATGKGAGDVVAIEEGLMIEYKANPKNFVNLLDHGAGELKDQFLPWKWDAGLSADKSQLIGLGTDVGGMAMCYRSDLFKKAGLPTERDAVSALWAGGWDQYIETGKKFVAANTGASFIDGAAQTYNVILLQEAGNTTGYTYYDTQNNLVVDKNPAIKAAYDKSIQIVDAKLSGKFPQWDASWSNAFKQSKFATMACPAWMTGVIEGNAGASNKGKWDIAKVPGNGGNWGGSHLAVPAQSKHPKEAAELAKFLTSKEGQIAAFKAKGPLPSNVAALDDPAVKDSKNPYFNNAPIGTIFGEGAKTLKPVYMGPKNQAVRTEVEASVRNYELGKKSAAEGWTEALANAKKAAAK